MQMPDGVAPVIGGWNRIYILIVAVSLGGDGCDQIAINIVYLMSSMLRPSEGSPGCLTDADAVYGVMNRGTIEIEIEYRVIVQDGLEGMFIDAILSLFR